MEATWRLDLLLDKAKPERAKVLRQPLDSSLGEHSANQSANKLRPQPYGLRFSLRQPTDDLS